MNQEPHRPASEPAPAPAWRPAADWPFVAGLAVLCGAYLALIAAMLAADVAFTTPGHLMRALASREIRYSIRLSLLSCTLTTLLSLWVAVPTAYLMSRTRFPGKRVVELLLDAPVVLPPLVLGLSLLILFQTPPGRALQQWVPVTFEVPSVVLAQFAVAAAFAVRTMQASFDEISPRCEQVALTLGCNRSQAFWRVALPGARRGIVASATLAWARSLGEFGPILIFSGATRMRTEVLTTSVFLELSVGNLEAAVAVSLLMIAAAAAVLSLARAFGPGALRDRGLPS